MTQQDIHSKSGVVESVFNNSILSKHPTLSNCHYVGVKDKYISLKKYIENSVYTFAVFKTGSQLFLSQI